MAVGTLTQERVNEFCPKTAEFEDMLAQMANATPTDGRSAQQWGTAVHTTMQREVERRYDPSENVVRAEFSLMDGREERRGLAGTSRLDILHRVEGTDTICAYDIKTGQAQINPAQAARIYEEARRFGERSGVANPQVLVIELHRTR